MQPSYVKGGASIVYHQNRDVRLDRENQRAQHISEEELRTFYSCGGVRQFPNTGRELEVQEEREAIYDQTDDSCCSEAEKRLLSGIRQEYQRHRKA